jgi:hypothetical protein
MRITLMQKLFLVIFICSISIFSSDKVELQFETTFSSGKTLKYLPIFTCSSATIGAFETIKNMRDSFLPDCGSSQIVKTKIPISLPMHQIAEATYCMPTLIKLVESSEQIDWSKKNILAHVKWANYFEATEKVKQPFAQSAALYIVRDLEPYFLDAQKKFPEAIDPESFKDYFFRALSHLSDTEKLEKKKIWYPIQYTNVEFAELFKAVHKYSDALKVANRNTGKDVDDFFKDRTIASRLTAWENSCARKAYKSLEPHIPTFSPDVISKCIVETYGDRFFIQPMPGEEDQNFLHIPLLALCVRAFIVGDCHWKCTLDWNFGDQARFLCDSDITHLGIIGARVGMTEFKVKLRDDAKVPWQSLCALKGSEDDDAYYRGKYHVCMTQNSVRESQCFKVLMPASYHKFFFNAMVIALPFVWHLCNRKLLFPWIQQKTDFWWAHYEDRVRKVNNQIPDEVKCIGSYLLNPHERTENIVKRQGSFTCSDKFPWPPFTGDYRMITFEQAIEAKEAMDKLRSIDLNFNCAWNRYRGLRYAASWMPYLIGALVVCRLGLRLLGNIRRKYKKDGSGDYRYRYLDGDNEPRPYRWRDVIMATLFENQNLAVVRLKNGQ